MFNKFKNFFTSNLNMLVSLIACMTIVSVLSFMATSLNINSKSNDYTDILTSLSEANENLSEAIDKLSINADLACTKLDESTQIIDDITTTLLTFDNSYSNDETFICISSLVDKTSDLYDLSKSLISNPNDLNDADKIDKLSSTLEECNALYEKLNTLGVNINFGKDTQTFFENTINYANTIITINRDTDIKEAANKDFLLKLDNFTKPLKTMSQDLMPAVNKIRSDKRSFDPLLDDIAEKKKTLEDIKNKLNLLSIPEDCVHFYNSLNDTLVLYDKYITTFENAVLFEKSCESYDNSKTDIDKKYNNAISKYTDTMNSYNTYKKLFE